MALLPRALSSSAVDMVGLLVCEVLLSCVDGWMGRAGTRRVVQREEREVLIAKTKVGNGVSQGQVVKKSWLRVCCDEGAGCIVLSWRGASGARVVQGKASNILRRAL